MCFFLTVAVPAAHLDRMTEAFGRGFQLLPTANATVLSALPSGYEARLVTSGMCSCDLYSCQQSVESDGRAEHLRRKYAKRGWSEAKIARAIEEALDSSAAPVAEPGLRADVVDRLQALCDMTSAIALFVHWYSGDVETERLSLVPGPPCDRQRFPSRAASLAEDEVLHVVALR